MLLYSWPVQKTNYERKQKWVSACGSQAPLCLFTELMCFPSHNWKTKPIKQFYPLNLLMLLSAIIYNEPAVGLILLFYGDGRQPPFDRNTGHLPLLCAQTRPASDPEARICSHRSLSCLDFLHLDSLTNSRAKSCIASPTSSPPRAVGKLVQVPTPIPAIPWSKVSPFLAGLLHRPLNWSSCFHTSEQVTLLPWGPF